MAGRISFGFAFNNSHFSDRLLVFEVSDSPALIRPHCKESVAMENEEDGGERICHVKMMNTEDSDLQNEEDGEMSDECGDKLHVELKMDEDLGHRRFQGMKEGKLVEEDRRLMQLHVNSVILASHSEYFMSLFCNGMSESSSEIVVVQVTEEERQGLINLIEYMYTGELKLNTAATKRTTKKKNLKENLPPTKKTKKKKTKNLKEIHLKEESHAGMRSSSEEALRLLGLADRFAISSCMEQLLKELDPSSNLHDCLLVLGLPETLKSNPALSSIVSSACNHLRSLFLDISPASKLRSELLSLPIEAFKVVLGSDLLHVQHEEEVFTCLSDWLESNFSGNGDADADADADGGDAESEDRSSSAMAMAMAMAASELSEMVRFPWLTGDFLEDIVSSSSFMRSDSCQALIMEALRFRSFTPARQHRLMLETISHHRFRPRNAHILDSFWGSCRSYVLLRTASSCHAHFEFPLEMVVCMGDSFGSRTLTLGGESFFLRASPMSIRTPYLAARVTCRIELIRISNGNATMLMMNPCNAAAAADDDDDDVAGDGDGDEETSPPPTWLHYTISVKRSFTQDWDSTHSGYCDLLLPPPDDGDDDAPCARFDDLFPGWFVERGFSYPRWNASNSGTVFFKLDLRLCSKPDGV